MNLGTNPDEEDDDDDVVSLNNGKTKAVGSQPEEPTQTKIILVDRGDCSFVTKVRNAERAGASLVVVIDDRSENITNVIMGDDGTGMGIRIPSMLVGKKSGQLLREFALSNNGQATISAEFNIDHPDNRVEIEFWYSSNNVLALDFIKEFDKYMPDLQYWVDFTPRFVTWACPSCTDDFKKEECFGNGAYCAPNHGKSFTQNIKGKDIIMEDLRQSCLHNQLKHNTESSTGSEWVWWDYMKYVHQECFDFITKECSEEAHKDIGVDFHETENCVKDSFGKKPIQFKAENRILRDNAEAWTEYGTLYWPSITINRATFRGDITPENILEAVCAGLKEKPDICLKFYEEENIHFDVPKVQNSVTAELLILVVVLLIGVNVLLLIAYRRCAKREMEQDIGLKVSSAVSQYVQLSQ